MVCTSYNYCWFINVFLCSIVDGTRQITLDHSTPANVSLMLPTAPSSYTVVPALSSRLRVTSSGHFISTGQLQASDAGTYMITSSDFDGVLNVTLTISGELLFKHH